jgi:quercetin dioxygenase-like cupin family protein
MSTSTTPRWFLADLAHVRVSRDDTSDRLSILELACPPGDTPPLHVHHTEDEAFFVLEGSARIYVGSDVHEVGPGDSVLAPKGIPHTYVTGDQGVRWVVTTSPGDFERFVVAVSRPAEAPVLPPPPGPPSEADVKALTELAAEHGIEILGPPGALPS